MKKVVINKCYGGFGLSLKAEEEYLKLIGKEQFDCSFFDSDIKRDDVNLIAVIEKLGEEANGDCASLSIVEIPNDVSWEIDEYDGMEHIAEKHRTWG